MLLKNFGVTRHGRVVFYDYDELASLLDCSFRAIPVPPGDDAEFASEPWFSVGPNDVFPAEFSTFLGVQGPIRYAFNGRHAELFDHLWWRSVQARVAAGELIEIYPYEGKAQIVSR